MHPRSSRLGAHALPSSTSWVLDLQMAPPVGVVSAWGPPRFGAGADRGSERGTPLNRLGALGAKAMAVPTCWQAPETRQPTRSHVGSSLGAGRRERQSACGTDEDHCLLRETASAASRPGSSAASAGSKQRAVTAGAAGPMVRRGASESSATSHTSPNCANTSCATKSILYALSRASRWLP